MSKSASANEPKNITFRQVNYILYVLLKEKNPDYTVLHYRLFTLFTFKISIRHTHLYENESSVKGFICLPLHNFQPTTINNIVMYSLHVGLNEIQEAT